MSWEEASKILFTGYGPGLYFVGYEMAKAINLRYGSERLASFLQKHHAAFLQTYIDFTRERPTLAPAAFSQATRDFIAAVE
jgi:hypothetical protein